MPLSCQLRNDLWRAQKKCGIALVSALPETWLVHLIGIAEEDPRIDPVCMAKEEEGVGYFCGRAFCRRKIRHAD
jgi:sulfopyruvate decarboxylase subunit alpha